MEWYVIHTKPRKENDVSRHLGLAGLEVLNPKVKSFASGLRPLFPNYMFLRWDLSQAHHYHVVRYTRGVNRILGTPEYPVPISDDVIKVIKDRLGSGSVLEQHTLRVGSRVKVKKGLLKDLIAVLEKPVSAAGRVSVLLRIHERQMRAVLSCRDIALVA